MKKKVLSTFSILLVLVALTASLTTVQAAEPRYTGIARITSGLNISSSGRAACYGKALLRDGYTANVTVVLKQDGVAIKTWTTSGSEMVTIDESYYVMSGHEYVVTTIVTVHDSNGNWVESPSLDSATSTY